ncbi:TadE family protein [Intrasporangium calvum]|uniref:TadE family protein n=1 Tax=Intrasporangium calvum TaxID=53358 RepID=UPI000A0787E0|nr:TadE family protein [Intrasporangium calvum]
MALTTRASFLRQRIVEGFEGTTEGSERGASAVEFALVLPLLFLILAGIVDFGRFMFTASTLTNAAREGARVAVVSDPYSGAAVTTRARAASQGMDPELVNVIPPAACPADSDIVVRVTYPFEWIILGPAVSLFGGPGPTDGIEASASMRCGG